MGRNTGHNCLGKRRADRCHYTTKKRKLSILKATMARHKLPATLTTDRILSLPGSSQLPGRSQSLPGNPPSSLGGQNLPLGKTS